MWIDLNITPCNQFTIVSKLDVFHGNNMVIFLLIINDVTSQNRMYSCTVANLSIPIA